MGNLSAQQKPIPGRNVNVNGGPTWVTYDPMARSLRSWVTPGAIRASSRSATSSSRNPAVIVCSAVYYGLVDIPGGAFSDSVPPSPHPDSWNMIAQSRDGGLTWMSRPHYGFPLDTSGRASLLKKYQFGADPMIRFGAAGAMLHVGLAANRGNNALGAIYSSTWIHLNNHEYDPEPVKFTGILREITTGSAGQFRDRPHLAMGEPDGRACTFDVPVESFDEDGNAVQENVHQEIPCTPAYVAYATFTGDGRNARSKIQFTKSYNLGRGWTQPITVNEQASVIAQGTQVVKIPGTRKVIVFWRRGSTFNLTQTDAIMMAVSQNDGDSFGKAVKLADIYPFDQSNDATRIRFRTMPNAAAGDGVAYIVWSDRRNPDGTPNMNGTAEGRVVIVATDGTSATAPMIVAPSTQGHQIFPTVAAAAGKIHVAWMDLRQDASKLFESQGIDEMKIVTDTLPAGAERKRHTADMYAAESSAPRLSFGEAFLVSQYVMGIPEGERASRQLQWNVLLARNFNKMTIPFHGDYNTSRGESIVPLDPFSTPQVWGFNLGKAGTPPRAPVFHDFWTDGRNMQLVSGEDYGTPIGKTPRRYTPPSLGEILDEYDKPTFLANGTSLYDQTQVREECGENFVATKNLDIYTSRTTRGFYAFAPWNHKTLGYRTYDPSNPDKYGVGDKLVQRAFPLVVENTGDAGMKSFELEIMNQPPGGTASFDQFGQRTLDSVVDVPPHSMAARTVFVTSTDEYAPVRIEVRDTTTGPPSATTIFLNPDRTAPRNLLQPGQVDTPFDVSRYEVHDVDITGVIVQDINMQQVSGQGFDATDDDWQNNEEWMDPGWRTPGWRTPGWRTPGWRTPGWRTGGWETPGWRTADWENPGWRTTADWESPGWRTEGWQAGDFSDGASSRYITAKVVSNGCKAAGVDGAAGAGDTRCENTYSTHNANVLVNGADPSLEYQLIVYKVYATPGTRSCDHKLVRNTQVVVNIPYYDPSPANFNTIDPRASFVLGPDETAFVVLVGFAHGPGREIFQNTWLPPGNTVFKVTPDAVNTDQYLDYVTCPDRPGCTPPETPPSPVPVPSRSLFMIAPAIPDGAVGSLYSTAPFQVVGGAPDYTWSISSGNLPVGVLIDPGDGHLSGTPTQAGTFTFAVTVTDSSAQTQLTDTQQFTLGIAAGAGDIIVADGGPGLTGRLLSIRPNGSTGEVFAQMPSGAPSDVVRNRNGESFVAIPSPPTIVKVARTGAVSTVFQGSPLVSPIAIAVDSAGSLYVGDNVSETVHRLTQTAGVWSVVGTVALSAPAPSGQNIDLVAEEPGSVIVGYENWDGNLSTGTYIERITFGATPTSTLILSPAMTVEGYRPHQLTGLAVDPAGNFIVTDMSEFPTPSRGLYRISADGSTSQLIVDNLAANPTDVEVDAAGNYIVSSNGVGAAYSQIVQVSPVPPTGIVPLVTAPQLGLTYANSLAIVDDVFITTGSLPDATGGTLYSQPLAARGGTNQYSWSLANGSSLPPGLTLNPTSGTVSGTPTQGGTFTFSVSATDTSSPPLVDTRALSMLVEVDLSVVLRKVIPSQFPIPYTTIGVTISSNGTQATGVRLRTDPLPSGLEFAGFARNTCPSMSCSYNSAQRTVTCPLSSWPGTWCEMWLGVSFSLEPPRTLGLSVRANQLDPNLFNNYSTINITAPLRGPVSLDALRFDQQTISPFVLPGCETDPKLHPSDWPVEWPDTGGLK